MRAAELQTVFQIVELVCRHFRVTVSQLESRNRERHIVWPRHVAMLLIRRHTQLGTATIGALFKKGHGTVVHALQAIESDLQTSCAAGREIAWIESQLTPPHYEI